MSVDLFCYSSLSLSGTKSALGLMVNEHAGLFDTRFIISAVEQPGALEEEIALEHGLSACSAFLVHLNDKSAADLVPTVLSAIKSSMGEDKVVILSDGGNLR